MKFYYDLDLVYIHVDTKSTALLELLRLVNPDFEVLYLLSMISGGFLKTLLGLYLHSPPGSSASSCLLGNLEIQGEDDIDEPVEG